MWLADHLRGKDVLLLAGSNAEAADLSRRVQARLTQLGQVGPPAGRPGRREPGRHRRPDPRPPQHRDRRRRPQAHQPRHPQGHRHARPRRRSPAAALGRHLDRAVPGSPRPTSRTSAELAYAGNVHVAQGRTVDTAHLLVTELPVPAGPVRRHDPRPRSQHRPRRHRQDRTRPARSPTSRPPPNPSSPASCSATPDDLSATEQIRQAQEWASGTGHLLNLWSAAVRPALYPEIDQQITARAHRIRSLALRAANTPARPSSRSCAPPSSPATTSARSSTRSPARRWTVPGPSPASCTAACSTSPCPSSQATT